MVHNFPSNNLLWNEHKPVFNLMLRYRLEKQSYLKNVHDHTYYIIIQQPSKGGVEREFHTLRCSFRAEEIEYQLKA